MTFLCSIMYAVVHDKRFLLGTFLRENFSDGGGSVQSKAVAAGTVGTAAAGINATADNTPQESKSDCSEIDEDDEIVKTNSSQNSIADLTDKSDRTLL